jgi:hypothetical protein
MNVVVKIMDILVVKAIYRYLKFRNIPTSPYYIEMAGRLKITGTSYVGKIEHVKDYSMEVSESGGTHPRTMDSEKL